MTSEKSNFLEQNLSKLRNIQKYFNENYKIDDIWSNSKIYELLVADALNHDLIPGHSGSRDSIKNGHEYEIKHFKESSSNHSWTFNDYSDDIIQNMIDKNYTFIFAHIDDLKVKPQLDWYFEISGIDMGAYLKKWTKSIQNNRKMINVSANQIIQRLNAEIKKPKNNNSYKFTKILNEIFEINDLLEKKYNLKNLMTSSKIWELLLAEKLGHKVNSEQGGRAGAHDAYDQQHNHYEYKISKSTSWNFQDISQKVLSKYLEDKSIVLAKADKKNLKILEVIICDPIEVVELLRSKLEAKKKRFELQGKSIRRRQVSITKREALSLSSTTLL